MLKALSYDVAHLILLLLSISDLAFLRLVSREYKAVADGIFYSRITLHDVPPDSDTKQAQSLREKTNYYIQRLLSPGDEIAGLVRWLKIQALLDSGGDFSVDDLMKILRVLKLLHSFSWNTPSPLPNAAVLELETLFPHCRLFLNINRTSPVARRSRLLSSPLLHSLDYALRFMYPKEQRRVPTSHVYSELAYFTLILTKTPRLTHLELHFSSDSSGKITDEGYEELHDSKLSRAPSDPVPALRSLVLDCRAYTFPISHCSVFVSLLNLSSLRSLDLRGDNSISVIPVFKNWPILLSALTGRVRNLRHLSLGKIPVFLEVIVKNLLLSIQALDTLRLERLIRPWALFPTFATHKASLVHLGIIANDMFGRPSEQDILGDKELETLAIEFPLLTSLELNVRLGRTERLRGWLKPIPDSLLHLARIPRLESLKVHSSYPLSDTEASFKPYALALFRALCPAQQRSRLKELRVEMWRFGSWSMAQAFYFRSTEFFLVKKQEQQGLKATDEGGLVCEKSIGHNDSTWRQFSVFH